MRRIEAWVTPVRRVAAAPAPPGHRAPGRWPPAPCGTRPHRPAATPTSTAADADGHRNAHVGPEPETMPASAPASTPARSVRRRPGVEAQRRGLQVVAEQRRQLARDRPTPARPAPVRDRRAAAAASRSSSARSRSISANTVGRRQPAVGERQHPVKGVAGQHRRQLLAAAGTQRGAAVQRERHVAAEFGGQRVQVAPRHARAPTARSSPPARPRRRRCRPPCRRRPGSTSRSEIATSGARPTWSAISSAARHARLRSSVGSDVRALAGHLQRQHVGVADGDLVEQRHGVEDGGQLVIAVVAEVADVEVQVDLAGHAHRDRTGGHPLGCGASVGHGTTLSPTRGATSSHATRKAARIAVLGWNGASRRRGVRGLRRRRRDRPRRIRHGVPGAPPPPTRIARRAQGARRPSSRRRPNLTRLQREFEFARQLDHPHVVAVYDRGPAG